MANRNPPHYRRATPGGNHCGNCGAFVGYKVRGYCKMYERMVSNSFVCDEWYPSSQLQLRIVKDDGNGNENV